MALNNIKVSIIIPVYNKEDWLYECLDSARNQTLRDIEIICIDDGSSDSSGSICDRFAEEDSRFRVVHQSNTGQAGARNRGLDMATGEYIAFLDSDDWLDPCMCEHSLAYAHRESAKVVMFCSRSHYPDRIRNYSLCKEPLTVDQMLDMLFWTERSGYVIWNKL